MLIVDANFRASQLFRAAGYDVLDIGFYMRNHALYSYRMSVVGREHPSESIYEFVPFQQGWRALGFCRDPHYDAADNWTPSPLLEYHATIEN